MHANLNEQWNTSCLPRTEIISANLPDTEYAFDFLCSIFMTKENDSARENTSICNSSTSQISVFMLTMVAAWYGRGEACALDKKKEVSQRVENKIWNYCFGSGERGSEIAFKVCLGFRTCSKHNIVLDFLGE